MSSGDARSYLPSTWSDDGKMDLYFGPFRQNRDVNPQAWDSKMKFWTGMVCEDCLFQRTAVIDSCTLNQHFLRNGKVPKCLSPVLKQMIDVGDIVSLNDYESSLNSGWIGWGWSLFVKAPVKWAWKSTVGGQDSNPQGKFVLKNQIQAIADNIIKVHRNELRKEDGNNLISIATLSKHCSDFCNDDLSLMLVLKYLKKQGQIDYIEKEKLVKFCDVNETRVTGINESDIKMYKLHKTEGEILDEIAKLYDQANKHELKFILSPLAEVSVTFFAPDGGKQWILIGCLVDAKKAMASGQKAVAKNHLRQKKAVMMQIDKREAALSNIRSVLMKINSAGSDKKIIEAYEVGSELLKANNEDINLDKIDSTMTDLQQVMEDQEELQASLMQGFGNPADDISTSELEAELELLGMEEELENSYPEVPKSKNPVAPEVEIEYPKVPANDPLRELEHSGELDGSLFPTPAGTPSRYT